MKRIVVYNALVYPSEEEACLADLARVGGVKVAKRRDPLPPDPGRRPAPGWDAVTMLLHIDAPKWTEVQTVLDEHAATRQAGAGPRIYREECMFTAKELDEAELLAVLVRRSPLDYIGLEGGMKFDWLVEPTDSNPAPWCWQKTPRLMRKTDMPKAQVGLHSTIPLEVIIHKRLLDAVPGFKYKHVKLGPVLASGAESDWVQLMSERMMPPYHEATTGIKTYHQEYAPPGSPRTIVHEMTDGYWPAYHRTEIINRFGCLPPVNFTHELEGWWGVGFGLGPKPAPGDLSHQHASPQPRLIIDQQTRRDLRRAGVTRLQYVPVRLLE